MGIYDFEISPEELFPGVNISGLPAGMRNNNPGNIKYVGRGSFPGVLGPSSNLDQGDPQAVFTSPQAGMQAARNLALRKYQGGKTTLNDLIAGKGGWTPGNYQSAANIARSMGIRPTDDLSLTDPSNMNSFLHGLVLQEHGQKGGMYGQNIYDAALGTTLTSAPTVRPVPSFPNPATVQPGLSAPNVARPAAPMVGPQPGLSAPPPPPVAPVAPKPLIPGTGLSGIGNIASALGGLADLFKPKPTTPPPDYSQVNAQAGQSVAQGIAARQQGASQMLQGLLAKKKQEALLPAMFI